MNYRVEISPRAEFDLERQATWWAENYSMDQAVSWLETVRSQLKTLRQFPERCAVSAENDRFPFIIRDKIVGIGARPSHRAVFTIRESSVFVLTVRHMSQTSLQPDDL